MATLKDVAKLAGVSPSLVSYVLNGKKKVRPDTYQRIQNAIEQLDYYPDFVAVGLKTKRSHAVGVVISDMVDPYFAALLNWIEKDLAKDRYCMIVRNAENDEKTEKKCLLDLMSRKIDGMILIGTGGNDYSLLLDNGVPIVSIDRFSGESIPTVKTDNRQGGVMGTDYLWEKGYRDIIFIGITDKIFSQDREEGYRMEMKKKACPWKIQYISEVSYETVRAAVSEIIREPSKTKKAFFCSTDQVAAYALRVLHESGMKIPGQYAVLGYDDSPLCKMVNPPLTTVAQPVRQISKCAVKILMERLQGNKIQGNVFLQTHIVERESC